MKLQELSFRQQYAEFIYHSYEVLPEKDQITLRFHFEIPGLCSFMPQTVIDTKNLWLVQAADHEYAKRLAFLFGMAECVSYFKAVLPEKLSVRCGGLTTEEIRWWKKLYFNGLGEFLYRNGIDATEEELIQIEAPEPQAFHEPLVFEAKTDALVPIGGGKDSAVTATLLKNNGKIVRYFTVNDQKARTDTVLAAGDEEEAIIRTHRTIDPALLELNRRGFLNGHTPFSAIVAFLSAYCAFLIGAKDIVLSNESSANESNIEGLTVNHQYSKSYEFELDFSDYLKRNIGVPIRYFSLLRPFNELQIAKMFASLPQFLPVFRSCNAGSKKNIWCAACPKCLFVYCILSPFLSKKDLDAVFGKCMLDEIALLEDFKGLCGFSDVKPFECVGTVTEVRTALALTLAKAKRVNEPLPALLKYFDEHAPGEKPDLTLFTSWNEQNLVPDNYQSCVKEMYRYVSQS